MTDRSLSTPIYGVFVPMGLLIVGVGIIDYTKMHYGVIVAVILGAFKFWRGEPVSILHKNDGFRFQEVELESVTNVTHDTNLYSFKLPKENDRLGLPVGQSIQVECNGQVRNYCPIGSTNEGSFQLLIKTYPEGRVSKYMASLRQYQVIKIRRDPDVGPDRRFHYSPNMASHLGMIAGGTGITPMLSVIDAIVKNPYDTTKVSLIYANKSVDDILLKEDLDELDAKYPNFSVHYVVEHSPGTGSEASLSEGYVNAEVVAQHIDKEATILVCGPPAMVSAMEGVVPGTRTHFL